MTTIFHITTAAEADAAARSGSYAPPAFAAEGFIHCSYPRQVCAVAGRLFAGRPDLVLLEIDRAQLTCKIVDENLEGGVERFPHVYGRLPVRAIVAVHPFRCGADGRFTLPDTSRSGLSGPDGPDGEGPPVPRRAP
jgi:uncharacterized protein (DUF952 family)